MTKRILLCFATSLVLASAAPFWPAKAKAASGHVVITEIKLGGSSDPKEFIEIFNDTGAEVDLANFTLEYAKSGFDGGYCNSIDWRTNANPLSLVNSKVLSGSLAPQAIAVVELSMNDNAPGSVHLVEPGRFTIHDQVGWGAAPACYWGTPAAQPANDQSIKRAFGASGLPIINVPESNAASFLVSDTLSPGTDPCLETDCYPPPDPDPAPSDYLIKITELLPNPGSPQLDSADEYIELYNPYDFEIDLTGYSLYAGGGSTVYDYAFSSIILEPKEYRAFYSSTTGISLVNSSPGQAWLMSPNQVRVSETPAYPAGIGDDVAWALIGGIWQITDNPTVSADNQAGTPPDDSTPPASTTGPQPCPAGKYRNPATNRCKSFEVRPALAACQAGQQRNPATNRCRSIAVSDTKIKACAPGQVRNSDTNRCRKITAVKGTATSQPSSANPKTKINYALVAGVSALVLGYAIYEYRHDLGSVYSKLMGRFGRAKK